MDRKLKIVTIVGARPQLIKSKALSDYIESSQNLNEVVVHTGQHFDYNMSGIFFDELGIKAPKYNLGVHSLPHAEMVAKMITGIGEIISFQLPDWIVVYGDTNSTLAGAIAATKTSVPVAHVESGLRSNDMSMPEELNRVITDRISTLLCCPTQAAVENLKREGFPHPTSHSQNQTIANTGDVMLDVFNKFQPLFTVDGVSKIADRNRDYIVFTLHREAATNDLESLKRTLSNIQQLVSSYEVVMPIHPRINKMIEKHNLQASVAGITLIEPQSYIEMQRLLSNAKMLITDSGGLQKEAYFHKVPCITMRNSTEWTETVASGTNILCDPLVADIQTLASSLLKTPLDFSKNFYGNGNAAKNIAEHLLQRLC